MVANVIRAHGGLDQLRYEEVPDPRPCDGQVLIRVGAVGVNRTSMCSFREGMTGLKLPLPMITGRLNRPGVSGGRI